MDDVIFDAGDAVPQYGATIRNCKPDFIDAKLKGLLAS